MAGKVLSTQVSWVKDHEILFKKHPAIATKTLPARPERTMQ